MDIQLVIFDLDYTLWDCGTYIDHTSPPFVEKEGHFFDSIGNPLQLYPDVPEILDYLKHENYELGIASRTHAPDLAVKLLKMYNLYHLFNYLEIYPGSKLAHFKSLNKSSGLAYHQMLFFDDEPRNISEVGNLGVQSILVRDGMNMEMMKNQLG